MVSHYEPSPGFTPVAVYRSYLNLLSGSGEINQVIAVFGEGKESIFDGLGGGVSKKWTQSAAPSPALQPREEMPLTANPGYRQAE